MKRIFCRSKIFGPVFFGVEKIALQKNLALKNLLSEILAVQKIADQKKVNIENLIARKLTQPGPDSAQKIRAWPGQLSANTGPWF